MTLLLLDLDDTLLDNTMDSFIPAYLRGLSARMAPVSEPAKMIEALLIATNHMVADNNPRQTLEQKFDSVFFPTLGLQRPEVQHHIDAFYRDDFPSLSGLTQMKPAATRLVGQALSRGDRIAVATNPLFPRTAILQRISWAGLPADQIPFALIPSYETFHFGKPNPEYMAEFLAQLGWPEDAVVMVGDDPRLDITPARNLGIEVFWISEASQTWPGPGSEPPRGSLDDVIPWLDSQPEEKLLPDFSLPVAIKSILRSTPAALHTLIKGYSADELTYQPFAGEWSPGEVLCHLRDVECEVNLPRIESMLAADNPFIAGQDTDRWAVERQYSQQNPLEALDAFVEARMRMLAMLDPLNETDWDRPARHAIFGPTRLVELVNIIAGHDRLHVRQVFQSFKTT